ncbi:MAG TPA: signal peptidase I [Gemmatimonadaceae bacterium]|nr:signal peptidase I [Gemmatimonadaceae bacterium]
MRVCPNCGAGLPEHADEGWRHAGAPTDCGCDRRSVGATTSPLSPGAFPGARALSRAGWAVVAWLKTMASASVYAALIVTFGFQVARVQGTSMAPTLQDQDRLVVNKLAYRLHDPQVGDIVMLLYPLKPETSYVKRVIAKEGDLLLIRNGRVFRNGIPLDDSFVPPAYRGHDDWGPEVVPEGSYFVMGDHRTHSSDSRHWRYVPKKYIIGKVQLRWWPIGQSRSF